MKEPSGGFPKPKSISLQRGMAHLQQAYLPGLLILLVLASPRASDGQESSGTASGIAITEKCAEPFARHLFRPPSLPIVASTE